MFVKNIIMNACRLVGKKEVVAYLNGDIELTDEINDIISDMLIAINVANNSIAANYLPIRDIKKVNATQGKILFKNLSDKQILEIYSIKKNNKLVTDYKCLSNGIIIADGEYEVDFSTFPEVVGLDSEIDYYLRLNDFIFSELVVSEYYFLNGYNDEANIWSEKFNEQIQSLLRVKKSVSIPERRWL